MFIVEWLLDGQQVHREAMLGANAQAVLAVAKAGLPKVRSTTGGQPDSIRITDAAHGTATVEKIDV